MACVSYHGVMISLPEIFVAKRLIFIKKNVKNAIKTISGGLLTKIWWCKVTNYTLPRVFNIHKTYKDQNLSPDPPFVL